MTSKNKQAQILIAELEARNKEIKDHKAYKKVMRDLNIEIM